jgi:(p)ppGpp synthase/HD superfamily hydrolase
MEAAGLGEIVAGGCIVGPQEWACLACGYTWPLPPEALDEPVGSALALAYRAHRDQVRKSDGTPYVRHPIEVAHLVFERVCDPCAVAAALLHDAIEDTDLTAGDIADEVGSPVAAVIEALTERKDIRDYERRKLEHRVRVAGAGRRATAVFAADRLANLRALRAAYAEQGEAVARHFNASLDEKLSHLHRDVRMLKRVDPGNPFLEDLSMAASAFRSERAMRRASP